ncbi:MAG: hypothetical protein HY721_34355 [Planctomycetes bacterium]|nr:hypothetical protein [Planctomycetota bacterium]
MKRRPLTRSVSSVLAVLLLCRVSAPILASEPGAREKPRYAVVAEEKTLQDKDWKAVVAALEKKHAAKVFTWEPGGAEGLRSRLAPWRPRYVCFVARPDELAEETLVRGVPLCGVYYHEVGVLMRSLDGDPYDDALWAVLTGPTPKDALRVAAAKPLVVRRALSHVGSGWLEWLESGASFSEGERGKKWIKDPGKPPREVRGPDDTTAEFVRELNSGKVDMVSSSGHATEHDWQLGFSFKGGKIIPAADVAKEPEPVKAAYERARKAASSRGSKRKAALLGVDLAGEVHEGLADNPRIYYSPGTCLLGRVDGTDCMALDWIRHGAMQLFGHVGLQTRSCYAWGIAEYFLALQGRFSFSEAVWLNRQALHREVSLGLQDPMKYVCCRDEAKAPGEGRVFWETTVLYGDPAWEARAKPVVDPLYDQDLRTRRLADGREELTFTATMRRSALPSRPAAFLLAPQPRTAFEVKEGPADLVVADELALVPFWKPGDEAPAAGKEYRAVAVVSRSDEAPPAGRD